MSILIKNVRHGFGEVDIYIEGNKIVEIGKIRTEAEHKIDGHGKAVIPGFINAHTHAAMTLFRGYADDIPLQQWLAEKIWPLEARLSAEMVYWGTKLACIEMIRTGTVAFNDMYFFMEDVARAVEDTGLRAVLSYGFIDMFDEEKMEAEIKRTKAFVEFVRRMKCNRVSAAIGPHAIYTVSRDGLQWSREFAEEHDLLLHIHLAETKKEVDDSIKKFGMSPVKYLDSINFWDNNVIAAHAVWVSEKDMEVLGKKGVSVAHCPASNMKLGVGRPLPYDGLRGHGVNVSLGTDSCASNNNLDMMEEMKIAALLQKLNHRPSSLPAAEALAMATLNGAKALHLNSGEIVVGKLADLVLIDLENTRHTPGFNFHSDIVYASSSECIDTVICDGKILMQGKHIKDEKTTIEKVRRIAWELCEGEAAGAF